MPRLSDAIELVLCDPLELPPAAKLERQRVLDSVDRLTARFAYAVIADAAVFFAAHFIRWWLR